MKSFDIIIIGGGIVGLNTALSIINEDSNSKIAIVDYKPENSEAAGAMICTVTDLSEKDKHMQEMTDTFIKAGIFFQSKWMNNFTNKENIVLRQGIYYIANSFGGEEDLKEINYLLEIANKYQLKYEEVSYKDIPCYNPAKGFFPLKSIRFDSDFSIDGVSYLKDVKSILLSRNVSFFENKATEIINGKLENRVRLDDDNQLKCKYVICATGVDSNNLLSKFLNNKVIIHKQQGIGVEISVNNRENLLNSIRTPNRGFACGHHIVPRKNTVYLGSTSSFAIYKNKDYNVRALASLLVEGSNELNYNLLNQDISRIHVGYRPVTLDKKPIIDEVTNGVFIITGFYRNSFLLSPYFSTMLAKYIICGASKQEFEIYNLKRLDNNAPDRLLSYLGENKDDIVINLIAHYKNSLSENEKDIILKKLYNIYLLKNDFKGLNSTPFPESLALINAYLRNGI